MGNIVKILEIGEIYDIEDFILFYCGDYKKAVSVVQELIDQNILEKKTLYRNLYNLNFKTENPEFDSSYISQNFFKVLKKIALVF